MPPECNVTETHYYHREFTGCLISPDGVERHFIKGAYGREGDLPSIILVNGSQFWYKANPKRGGFGQPDALQHRDGDKPAVIKENGDLFYYIDGKLHRENDKPAVILTNGTLKWFIKKVCVAYQLPGMEKRVFNTKATQE